MGIFYEVSLSVFVFVTLILGGLGAYLTGRAIAITWRPLWTLVWFTFLLTFFIRFIHFALFDGTLLTKRPGRFPGAKKPDSQHQCCHTQKPHLLEIAAFLLTLRSGDGSPEQVSRHQFPIGNTTIPNVISSWLSADFRQSCRGSLWSTAIFVPVPPATPDPWS